MRPERWILGWLPRLKFCSAASPAITRTPHPLERAGRTPKPILLLDAQVGQVALVPLPLLILRLLQLLDPRRQLVDLAFLGVEFFQILLVRRRRRRRVLEIGADARLVALDVGELLAGMRQLAL